MGGANCHRRRKIRERFMGLVRAKSDVEAERASVPAIGEARLDDPSAAVRRVAVDGLAVAGGEGQLMARLLVEDDRQVRVAILLTLVRIGSVEVAMALAQLLGHDRPDLRNAALECLTALPGPTAGLLDQLALSEDADVRIFAVMLAGELGWELAGRGLTERAAAESDANVAAAIAEVLAEIGEPECIEALEDLQNRFSDQPFVMFAASLAKKRLQSN